MLNDAAVNDNIVTATDTDVNEQELNDHRIWSIAVGLTRYASTLDLISMSSSGSDYVRFIGSYRDLQGRVSDVEQLLCAVRPNSQFPSVVHCLLDYFIYLLYYEIVHKVHNKNKSKSKILSCDLITQFVLGRWMEGRTIRTYVKPDNTLTLNLTENSSPTVLYLDISDARPVSTVV